MQTNSTYLTHRGLIRCSRYSLPPNSLHYCGPEKQSDLAGYVHHDIEDQGLVEILSQFETLYEYLQLIAMANNIRDPFDERVVEAYWLGSSLLGHVSPKNYYTHLVERLKLPQRTRKSVPTKTIDTLVVQGFPFHTFHVLNIFVRTGHHTVPHTVATMDACRISWGTVVSVDTHYRSVVITSPRLTVVSDRITLGIPVSIQVNTPHMLLNVGDTVSVHWGHVCEVLTGREGKNLIDYTRKAIAVYNSFRA